MAVYGFTDAELRRTELIGNKTVTRKHLLELLDSTGAFAEAEEVTGRSETTVEFLGDLRVNVSVSLVFKASLVTCCHMLSHVVTAKIALFVARYLHHHDAKSQQEACAPLHRPQPLAQHQNAKAWGQVVSTRRESCSQHFPTHSRRLRLQL